MNDLDLCFMPATALSAAFRAKTVSPVQVVSIVLAQVKALEPKLNAFATFTPERALGATKAASSGKAKPLKDHAPTV